MASTVVERTIVDIFAGASNDASRFFVTLAMAITGAPFWGFNKLDARDGCAVVAAVLWAGRQADPNAAVDDNHWNT